MQGRADKMDRVGGVSPVSPNALYRASLEGAWIHFSSPRMAPRRPDSSTTSEHANGRLAQLASLLSDAPLRDTDSLHHELIEAKGGATRRQCRPCLIPVNRNTLLQRPFITSNGANCQAQPLPESSVKTNLEYEARTEVARDEADARLRTIQEGCRELITTLAPSSSAPPMHFRASSRTVAASSSSSSLCIRPRRLSRASARPLSSPCSVVPRPTLGQCERARSSPVLPSIAATAFVPYWRP
ncbi:uncharacterized protein LAESUDRAFT_94633 [Laetiporus sulphureus 93-53]|uniref:Uncharacterized protein n=1 Tax=Laetiporus sulphureus 93-53 TaxID=1314785 RepID=A0A165ATZ7_9APHY|nr:uncharacterized protein LAESUDRAFT_94633 [Laetiporus sulphureus 93-53]KZS99658.1 hypothetical protein LAESUDRAFT_94633 [Laetiporus sulphureus 93-53]